jgi:hypothetical protein
MSVTIGTYGANDATGWSVFTQTLGGTVYYVSPTLGSSTYNGLSPTHTTGNNGPFNTFQAAMAQVQANATWDGTKWVAKDDWVLIRKGDTIQVADSTIIHGYNQNPKLNGPNGSPLLISSYDETIPVNPSTGAGVDPAASTRARPLILAWQPILAAGQTDPIGNNIALVGLEFYHTWADPNSASYSKTNITAVANDGTGKIQLTVADSTVLWNGETVSISGVGGLTSLNYTYYTITVTSSGAPGTIVLNGSTYAAGYTSGGTVWNAAPPTCIELEYPVTFFLIENCRFSYYSNFLNAPIGPSISASATSGITIRRNIFYGCYTAQGAPGGASSAIYMDWNQNTAINENIFNHCGWNETIPRTGPTYFNHSGYLSAYVPDNGPPTSWSLPALFKGNIVARGISTQLRAGATCINNTFIEQAEGYNCGSPDSNPASDYEYNVSIDAPVNMSGAPYNTTGMSNIPDGSMQFSTIDAYVFDMVGSLTFSNNIAQNSLPTSPNYVFQIGLGWSGTAANNIAYGYGATVNGISDGTGTHSILTFTSVNQTGSANNTTYPGLTLSGGTGTGAAADFAVNGVGVATATVSLGSNYYRGGYNYTVGDVLTATSGGVTFHATVASVSSLSFSNNHSYASPTGAEGYSLHRSSGGSAPFYSNTIGAYNLSIGNATGTTDAFLSLITGTPGSLSAQGRSKQNWNSQLTAQAVNSYIRAGYGMADPGGGGGGGGILHPLFALRQRLFH